MNVGKISTRLSRIKPSPTLSVTQKAQEMKARGIDVISFSAGEPDFDTPPHIVDAAIRALRDGITRYTPVAGIPKLREAIAAQSQRIRGVPCAAKQVIVTTGAKHALYGFFHAVLNPGDEVVIPAPYWVSYPDQVMLAGGEPRIVETRAEDDWVLTPEALERAVTPRTVAVVINTPSNPTGGLYSKEAITAITRRAIELKLWIVADEIYRDLIYDGMGHFSPLSVAAREPERVFVVDGVSKTYAMTGWRIGWGIGDPEVIAAMSMIQGQETSNATSMCQAASLAAITEPADFLEGWRAEYAARRDAMVEGLNRMPGVTCRKPRGAFYVLPCVREICARMGSGATDMEVATYLLEKGRVATVPGTAFGASGYIRLSYATSMRNIEEGLTRVAEAFAAL
jgi:aspartate aminotransferase